MNTPVTSYSISDDDLRGQELEDILAHLAGCAVS